MKTPVEYDDAAVDAAIDRYHAGWAAHKAGATRPAERDAADGWDARQDAIKVVVVMPCRPEGYYHAAIGTFE